MSLDLTRFSDGRLGLRLESGEIPVTVTRCFPWSNPLSYLSLRNEKGEEKGFVTALDDLSPESRALLEEELKLTGQTFEIIRIHKVQKEIELRCWEVETQGGDRHFQTELDVWPRALPDGSLLVQDLYGDLYRIQDPQALDAASQKILTPLLG